MVTLEQVKLLESKVGKALSYVENLSAENATLREKLDGYRRRIDELETIVLAFKEDQGRIEAGIVSALERLNQFEDAVERGINEVRTTAESPIPSLEPKIETEVQGEATFAEIEESPIEPEIADDEAEIKSVSDGEQPENAEKNGELDIF